MDRCDFAGCKTRLLHSEWTAASVPAGLVLLRLLSKTTAPFTEVRVHCCAFIHASSLDSAHFKSSVNYPWTTFPNLVVSWMIVFFVCRVDLFIPDVEKVGGFSMCSSPGLLLREGVVELAVKYAKHPPAHWVHTAVSGCSPSVWHRAFIKWRLLTVWTLCDGFILYGYTQKFIITG